MERTPRKCLTIDPRKRETFRISIDVIVEQHGSKVHAWVEVGGLEKIDKPLPLADIEPNSTA